MTFERIGTGVLFLATVLVAISILLDGAAARVINGAAGITWFAAASLLGLAAWRSARPVWVWGAALVLTSLVAFVVKPVDFAAAVVGFGLAGTAIAIAGRPYPVLWSKLIVALYLPFHIGTAIARVLYRSAAGDEAAIRTDPPPTAALVPLVMLLTAIASGYAIQAWFGRAAHRRQASQRDLRHT